MASIIKKKQISFYFSPIYLQLLFLLSLFVCLLLRANAQISANLARGVIMFIPCVCLFSKAFRKIDLSDSFSQCFLFFILIAALQSFWGLNYKRSLFDAAALLILFLFVKNSLRLSVSSSGDPKQVIQPFLIFSWSILAINILVLAFFSKHFFTMPHTFVSKGWINIIPNHPFKGLLKNPSFSASLLLFPICFSALAFVTRTINKVSGTLLLIISLALLILINSRSALLAVVISLISFCLFNIKAMTWVKTTKGKIILPIFSLFALYELGLFTTNTFFYAYVLRVRRLSYVLLHRRIIWSKMINIWWQHHFWLGVGLSNQLYLLKQVGLNNTKGHNTYIDVLVTCGVLGFVIFMSGLVIAMKNLLQMKANVRLARLSFVVLLGLFVHSFFESMLLNLQGLNYFLLLFFYFYTRYTQLSIVESASDKA